MIFAKYVKGECQEKAGIKDGDIVVVDTDIKPAPPDKDHRHGDIAAVTIKGTESIKEYLGYSGRTCIVGTNYSDEYMKAHDRLWWWQDAHFIPATDIIGTVIACLNPDKSLKWEREARPAGGGEIHGDFELIALP